MDFIDYIDKMKITFITFHNWDTKRVGGFHKFAEACAKAGHEVVFFSYDRPYYIFFKNEERLNRNVLQTLKKGQRYKVANNEIVNCTWPTLKAPMPFHNYLPKFVNRWLEGHSLSSFNSFQKKFLKDTDIFVFESCAGVGLFDRIRQHYPKAKFVYRPSDPLMTIKASAETVKAETHILQNADLVLIVNKESLNLYKSRIPDFEDKVKYKILSNGVDVEQFELTYPCPDLLKGQSTALYVGARKPEWELIYYAAERMPDITFVIVCPEICPTPKILSQYKNIFYVPGIPPSEVPKWITNCTIVIIPNPKDLYKIKPWGITAKYYQAMAAKKTIVSFDDNDTLKEYGVRVSHDYESFVSDLREAFDANVSNAGYSFNLEEKKWDFITKSFINEIQGL